MGGSIYGVFLTLTPSMGGDYQLAQLRASRIPPSVGGYLHFLRALCYKTKHY